MMLSLASAQPPFRPVIAANSKKLLQVMCARLIGVDDLNVGASCQQSD
jgi:hypothetical protein